jgi:hypothetical protein
LLIGAVVIGVIGYYRGWFGSKPVTEVKAEAKSTLAALVEELEANAKAQELKDKLEALHSKLIDPPEEKK